MAAVLTLLITIEQLIANPDYYVVDTRPAVMYMEGHIPGAVNLDAAELSETRDGVKGLLKPIPELREIFAAAGIHPDKKIVLYSNMLDEEQRTFPTRVFWALDYLGYPTITILDGGYLKWREEGHPVETAAVQAVPVTLPELTPDPGRHATKEEVLAAVNNGSAVLLDMRPTAQYRGKEKADFVNRYGHIAGAESLPTNDLIAGHPGGFVDLDKMKKELAKRSVTAETPVIAYCNTGRSGSVGYYACRLIGCRNVQLYDASMAEWGSTDLPVVTGKKPR